MNSIHERQGTGAIREIPPTTIQGKVAALENRIKEFECKQREDEFRIKTLKEMVDRLSLQVVGSVRVQ